MKRTTVDSSMIHSVGYDAEEKYWKPSSLPARFINIMMCLKMYLMNSWKQVQLADIFAVMS